MKRTEKVFDCPRCHSTLNVAVDTDDNVQIHKFSISDKITGHFEAIMQSTYKAFLENHMMDQDGINKELKHAINHFKRLPKVFQGTIYRTIENWSKDDFINFDGLHEFMHKVR